jgi:hypothetical protein
MIESLKIGENEVRQFFGSVKEYLDPISFVPIVSVEQCDPFAPNFIQRESSCVVGPQILQCPEQPDPGIGFGHRLQDFKSSIRGPVIHDENIKIRKSLRL